MRAIIVDASSAFPSIEITKDIHDSRLHFGDRQFTFRFRGLTWWHAVVERRGVRREVRSINCTTGNRASEQRALDVRFCVPTAPTTKWRPLRNNADAARRHYRAVANRVVIRGSHKYIVKLPANWSPLTKTRPEFS